MALALALCACRGRSSARSDDAPLEVVVPTAPETLDPRYVTDAVGMRVTRLVHAGLFTLDEDSLAPHPYVASSARFVDERTLAVELRPGLRFHSGAALTAEDVVATLRAFGSPAVGSRHARVVEAIESVEATGPRSLVVRLRRPHGTLLTDLEVPILRASEASDAPRPDGSLDGLGPYRVRSAAGGVVALEPADTGLLARPAHPVVIRAVSDENARALRAYAGRADVLLGGLSPQLVPALTASGELGLATRRGASVTYLVMRTDSGPFADRRARRALASAVDRDRIARTLFAGHAERADSLLPPTHWAFHAPPSPLAFDQGASSALAAETELGRGREIELLCSTDRSRRSLGRALAAALSAAGIRARVRPLELGALLARLGSGAFDVALLQIPELTEPNVLRVFLHSASIPPAGANRGRVQDRRVDDLLDAGERTLDPDRRRAIYAELDAVVRDEAYLVPLWHEQPMAVVGPRARGFMPSTEGRWLGLARLP